MARSTPKDNCCKEFRPAVFGVGCRKCGWVRESHPTTLVASEEKLASLAEQRADKLAGALKAPEGETHA